MSAMCRQLCMKYQKVLIALIEVESQEVLILIFLIYYVTSTTVIQQVG